MSYSVKYALIRPLPTTFAAALQQSLQLIDVAKAMQQHQAYSRQLQKLVTELLIVSVSEEHPDCCFIEDTAIVMGREVIISRIGPISRRQETEAVFQCFLELQKKEPELNIHRLREPATLDGGDVLAMDGKLFVGLSARTNAAAIEQLESIFPEKVNPVPVKLGLHLKSVLSSLDNDTLLVGAHPDARLMAETILKSFPSHSPKQLIELPDLVAANVVRVGQTLMIQNGFPESQKILAQVAEARRLELVAIDMSELIKADGALTCCSILIR